MIVPVPVKETTCGLFAALSVMVRVPFTTPLTAGVKETEMVQLAPAARVAVQVRVWVWQSLVSC